MKKFLLIMLVAINCYSIPVEITSNPADLQKEMVTRIDSLTTIQGMISAINTAQSVQQQLQALKNLNNFQQKIKLYKRTGENTPVLFSSFSG